MVRPLELLDPLLHDLLRQQRHRHLCSTKQQEHARVRGDRRRDTIMSRNGEEFAGELAPSDRSAPRGSGREREKRKAAEARLVGWGGETYTAKTLEGQAIGRTAGIAPEVAERLDDVMGSRASLGLDEAQ
jgi:hypothetical protein